jgi:XRE family transcriptional regulator, regulator of sulfur utilization
LWGHSVPPKTRQTANDAARVRAFGERVRVLRQMKGLTQEQVAEAGGISFAEVGFIERAEREPGLVMIHRLADGLGVSASELLSG